MSCELNTIAYLKLLDKDIEWLLKQPKTLERDHIEHCLNWLRANRPTTEVYKHDQLQSL